MTTTTARSRTLHADPNVTPLIDVLLVLLIIFMVIVPVTPRGLDAMLPQAPATSQPPPARTLVVQILAGPTGPLYKINDEKVAGKAALADQLSRICAMRAENVLFVQGDPQLDFAAVAAVLDISRSDGVDHVVILTPRLRARDLRHEPHA